MNALVTAGKRWALVALYALLLFSLQPLLLDHTFAAGTSHEHSDQDACAWLDHAASAGLHSNAPPASQVQILTSVSVFLTIPYYSIVLSHISVRGPPILL
ncbi:MAG: hypothetical protein MRJ92_10710 [Nitrospira sp.]|nr:hypothetical protein [Nitrospira sp.]HAP38923.1 hypothetical protein [Nitrospira sp.]